MKLKEGGNPSRKEDWSEPKRVVRSDGSQLCEAGKTITLDMTCFFWEGDYYVVWSQRQFLPKDLGAWLYIAKLNADEPWKLLSEPVLLSKPEYGWANNHTFVDEGPFALPQEERLILTFSSAAVDTSYVVGIMTIDRDKDLLDPKNWKKGNYPIMTSRSVGENLERAIMPMWWMNTVMSGIPITPDQESTAREAAGSGGFILISTVCRYWIWWRSRMYPKNLAE